jgi:tetratricopeptide (TPR) repeat protein
MRFFPALVLIGFVLAGTTSAPAASNDLATCAKAAGDDAIAACGRLINSGARKGSELATVHVNRCLSWNAKKEYDRAVVDCSEAIRLDPKSSRAYGGRCWALNDKKDYDRAVLDCDEAIRLDPEYAAAYNNRCALWSARNDLDRFRLRRGTSPQSKIRQHLQHPLRHLAEKKGARSRHCRLRRGHQAQSESGGLLSPPRKRLARQGGLRSLDCR